MGESPRPTPMFTPARSIFLMLVFPFTATVVWVAIMLANWS